MKTIWRLLDTGVRSAAENMALDDVILECKSAGKVPNTLRFLQFKPPAVLVGYHQAIEQEVRLEYCERAGIEVNRRLTGGGAIYFDEKSLGWEVFASKKDLPDLRLEDLCRMLCEGAIVGLRRLGINASFRRKNDIEVNGRKISGTGGTERGGAFLFQGTLLVDFDVETMLKALRVPIAKLKDKEVRSLRERVTCLKWELGCAPSLHKVKEALASGFEEVLKVNFRRAGLTNHERELLEKRLKYFKSNEWIHAIRKPLGETGEVYALLKRPGGLIRASLQVDRERRIIKNVFITGDFFAFPCKAIMDLESLLKSSEINDAPFIIYDFFKSRSVEVPGLSPDDFVNVIAKALEKLSYERLGLTIEELNSIHTIIKDAEDILNVFQGVPSHGS